MAVSLKHEKVVVVPDDNSYPVGTDEWNAEHIMLLDSGNLLGRETAGPGPVEQISINTFSGKFVVRTGDTMLGSLILKGDPTLPLEPTTKQYVDSKIFEAGTGLVPDAPHDGEMYGRQSGVWVPAAEEAPIDGQIYVRRDSGWMVLPAPTVSSDSNNAALLGSDQGVFVQKPLFISDTAPPTTLTPGTLWWNSTSGVMYVLYDDGNTIQWVASTAVPEPGTGGGGAVDASVSISCPYSGKPTAGVKVNIPIAIAVTVAASLTGSVAFASTAATADAVFTLNKVSGGSTTAIGTVTMKASGVHTFAGAGGSLAIGDVLQFVAPGIQDTTLADVGITIMTTRA